MAPVVQRDVYPCTEHAARLQAIEADTREVRDRLIAMETRLDPIARWVERQMDRNSEVFRVYIWPAAMVLLTAVITHLAYQGTTNATPTTRAIHSESVPAK